MNKLDCYTFHAIQCHKDTYAVFYMINTKIDLKLTAGFRKGKMLPIDIFIDILFYLFIENYYQYF